MTTESRMREAPSDHEIERMLIDLGISLSASGMGPGFGHARSIVHETLKRWRSPEALPTPARRTSYEWVDEHGDRARVRWSNEQRRWIAEMIPPGCRSYHVYGGSAHYSFAAAIATLAGLTKPEEES